MVVPPPWCHVVIRTDQILIVRYSNSSMGKLVQPVDHAGPWLDGHNLGTVWQSGANAAGEVTKWAFDVTTEASLRIAVDATVEASAGLNEPANFSKALIGVRCKHDETHRQHRVEAFVLKTSPRDITSHQ